MSEKFADMSEGFGGVAVYRESEGVITTQIVRNGVVFEAFGPTPKDSMEALVIVLANKISELRASMAVL